MPTYPQIAWHGAMALLMGLLIGIEREHSQRADEPLFAGVRTFPIIVLSGYLCGLLTQVGFTWVLPVALAGTCAIVVTAYAAKLEGPHKGATTEFVAVLAFIFGALLEFALVNYAGREEFLKAEQAKKKSIAQPPQPVLVCVCVWCTCSLHLQMPPTPAQPTTDTSKAEGRNGPVL